MQEHTETKRVINNERRHTLS